jgi:putative tricarboxylic transport membrane protein
VSPGSSARLRASAPFLGLGVGATVLLAMARGMDAAAAAGRLGPGAWPTMVLGLLALLAGVKAVEILRSGGAATQEDAATAEGDPLRAIAALACFAAYCLVLELVGFPLATTLLLGSFLWIAGFRRPGPLLLTAVGGSVGLFLLFRTVVYVSMPLGREPFLSFSLGLLRLVGAG